MVTHRQKVQHLLAELSAKGVYKSTVAPPLFRQLWALGLEVPPPLFIHFLPLMLFSVIYFGIFFGVFAWLLVCRNVSLVLLPSAAGGILSGLAIAIFFRFRARTLKLPDWKDYQPQLSSRSLPEK
jgi:hypothetical protein